MVSIAVVDDNQNDIHVMTEYIDKEFSKLSVEYKIIPCSNGEDLLYVQDEIGKFDIIFLDIELNHDNGIDAARELRKNNPYGQIVFVSSYNKYYKDAFSVQPFQFVDKPIDEAEFRKIVQDVAKLVIDDNRVFAFGNKWKQYRILIKDILYFSSGHRIIKVHTRDGEVYEYYDKMGNVEATLEKQSAVFLRIHKSYLINMAYIKLFNHAEVVLQNGEEFKISVRKKKSVIEKYMKYAC